MDMPRLPLFKISADIFSAVSLDEIYKTASDMQEMDLYHPPYDNFLLQTKVSLLEKMAQDASGHEFTMFGRGMRAFPKAAFIFHFMVYDGKVESVPFIAFNGKNFQPVEKLNIDRSISYEFFRWATTSLIATLLVLLSTKNIEKETVVCNKPNSRSSRERRLSQYSSVTTIKIGKITETVHSQGSSGATVRPHMRRGHIRQQHFGENNAQIKKIFIQPVFVNADQGWIDQNKTYRVVA